MPSLKAPFRDYTLTADNRYDIVGPISYSPGAYLLKEDGGKLLLETGDKILIEYSAYGWLVRAPFRDYTLTAENRA
jgi:hypothetical protein